MRPLVPSLHSCARLFLPPPPPLVAYPRRYARPHAQARLLPRSKLNDREFVRGFAALSDPFVRAVDAWAGEAVVSEPLLLRAATAAAVACRE